MLVIHNVETVAAELAAHGRLRIANSLRVPPSWVTVRWVPAAPERRGLWAWLTRRWRRPDWSRGAKPQVDVADPVLLDPAVSAEVKEALPDLRSVLRERGIDDPERLIAVHVRWMVGEFRERLRGLS